MAADVDDAVRTAAFGFLAEHARVRGEWWPPVLPRDLLANGFIFQGKRVPLMGPQGIFKPAILPAIPLSITTTAPSLRTPAPYDDEFGYGHLLYRYRGTDPLHSDNVGLREAMHEQQPLIYFRGIVPGRYLAVWPVYVVGDSPSGLAFQVSFDPGDQIAVPELIAEEDGRRAYAMRVVKQRLHQVGFRERVLTAYRRTCAVCRLRHEELLDAAHIIPDGRPRGDPVIPNGLSLCKLHHSAFDANIIGIRPDLTITVRADVLAETDGPMLLHGLQETQNQRIWVPRVPEFQPGQDRLEERYEEFVRAS